MLIENPDSTAKSILKLPEIEPLSEQQSHELKKYLATLKDQSSNNKRIKSNPKKIASILKDRNYSALQNIPIDQIIKGIDRLKLSATYEISTEVIESTECLAPELSLALASFHERKWPEQQAKNMSLKLYEKTYSCATGEIRARAAYRLALFSVADANCEKSFQYWPSITESNEAQFLVSRSIYWKNFCETKLQKASASWSQFYQDFPLSYHPILLSYETQQSLAKLVSSQKAPLILARTSIDEKINQLIAQVELAIENKNMSQARHYLSWLNDDSWRALEPEFLIYIGYLANVTKQGLIAFKTVSRAISEKPELNSSVTLKVFYPKWFYDNIQIESQKNGLDPLLVMSLVRQESAFETRAQSPVGARGLMQLMPRTAKSLLPNFRKNDLFNPDKNLQAGTKFLARLLKKYDGNVVFALAAYNAGPQAVDSWIQRYQVSNPTLFKDLIPYRETREYVASILRNWYWYQVIENESSTPYSLSNNLDQKERLYK